MANVYYKIDGGTIYYCNDQKEDYLLWDPTDTSYPPSGKTVVVELNSANRFWFPENASGLFRGCKNSTFDVTGWHTENCADFSYLFYGCNYLSSLDLSSWDVSNVTTMSRMFQNCNNITSLNMSGWDTSHVTNFGTMFWFLQRITNIDVSHFNTSSATNMSHMFRGCSRITELDLTKWDMSHVTTVAGMFYGCKALTTIKVPVYTNWNTMSNITTSTDMFAQCTALPNFDENSLTKTKANNLNGGYFSLSDVYLVYYYADTYGQYIKFTNEMKANYKVWDPSVADLNHSRAITVELYNNKFILPTNSSHLFNFASNSRDTLNILNWDTSHVEDMSYLFYGSPATYLNLSSFDTSNVKDMSYMFYRCYELLSLSVNHFDTSNVTTMEGMFSGMDKIQSLEVNRFDTSKVTNMHDMFSGDTELRGLDLTGFDMTNVTDVGHMFANDTNLNYILVPEGTDWQAQYPHIEDGGIAEHLFYKTENLPNYVWLEFGLDHANNIRDNGYFGVGEPPFNPKKRVIYEKLDGVWNLTTTMIKDEDSWKTVEVYV